MSEVLREADVISLHPVLDKTTYHLINNESLATMKKAVREHNPLGRDVEPFRRDKYGAGKVDPTIKGNKGAELMDGLVIKEEDYKIVKTRFSSIFATNLHSFLQTEGIKNLIITGKWMLSSH